MKNDELTKIEFASLVFEYDIYPRQATIDTYNIRKIADGIEAGDDVPPILVDEKTYCIVDGFHRARAYKQLYGNGAMIPAVVRKFKNMAEMAYWAAKLNAKHGMALNTCDKAHFFMIAKRHGISFDRTADALGMTATKLEKLIANRLAFSSRTQKKKDEPDIALKRPAKKLAYQVLTKAQQEANRKLGGLAPTHYARHLLSLVQNDMLDKEDETLMELLRQLNCELSNMLATKI